MKTTTVVNVLLICSLVALASAKSVRPIVFRSNVDVTDIQNATESALTMREATVDPTSVQVVADLSDSGEVAAADAIATDAILDNNDIANEISDASSVEKPVNPLPDRPVSEAIADPISAAVETNQIQEATTEVNVNDPNPINKYCSCSSAQCKCCRDFSIPLIPVRGPGCATVRYLDNDKLSVQIKYGDFVLASRQIDSRRSTPVCLPLPGGFNRFCGRIYGVSRENENFKACLGLELRADDDVEASMRVSCFQFGPRGLATMEAEPLPPIESEDDDDDDDDDLLGLGGLADGDDDDDDDDEEEGAAGGIVADVLEGVGVGGGGDDDVFAPFSLLGSASDFFGGLLGTSQNNNKKKPSKAIAVNEVQKGAQSKNALSGERIAAEETKNKTKVKDENDDDSSEVGILDAVEAMIEELGGDEEDEDDAEESDESNKDKPIASEKTVAADKSDKEEKEGESEYKDSDYDDDQYKDEQEYNEVDESKEIVDDENEKTKKDRMESEEDDEAYDLGLFGRFLNFFK